MNKIIVEKGKLSGKYKTIDEFDADSSGGTKAAWRSYFNTVLEAGQKKRIRQGTRTLKQRSCYWT